MKNYTIDPANKWDYENGFYLTCETSRIGKFLNHLEIYKKILSVEGDVMEFGVYKGASLSRIMTFRDLLEKNNRKVIGFDAFGKFPRGLSLESDKEFADKFEEVGGYGISKEELTSHYTKKGFENFELIEGDILATLDQYLIENPEPNIALLHIDVDVYEPTKFILEKLWKFIKPGGVLMLDDYNTVEGETKAVNEFFQDDKQEIEFLPYYKIPAFIVKK